MTEYSLVDVKGIPSDKINSFKSLVNHQAGPNPTISLASEGNGNYRARVITPSNYSGLLANSLSMSGYASDVGMPVGISGSNADYDTNLM
jgi:hypothetical protein